MKCAPMLIVAAFLAAPCSAEVGSEQASATRVVRTADLDLSHAADRTTLERRLDRAIIDACGSAPDYDLAGQRVVARCHADTRAQMSARRDAVVARAIPRRPVEVAGRQH